MKNRWKIIPLFSCIVLLAAGCQKEESGVKKGMELVQKGQYEESFAYFEQAIDANKDVAMAYRGEGLAYMGLKDYGSAVEVFDEALDQKNKLNGALESDISYYKASAQMKNGNYKGAVKTYTNISGFQKSEKANYLRGVAYLSLEKKEKALKDFKQAAKLSSGDSSMCLDIFQSLEAVGYGEDGKAFLKTILEQNQGKDEKDKKIKGIAYYYLGKYEKALKEFEQCIKKEKEDAEVYNWLGMCKMKLNDKTAIKEFEKGIALKDKSVMQNLLYNEIVAYEMNMDFEKAKEKMDSYLKKYPEDTVAVREYEFLKTR